MKKTYLSLIIASLLSFDMNASENSNLLDLKNLSNDDAAYCQRAIKNQLHRDCDAALALSYLGYLSGCYGCMWGHCAAQGTSAAYPACLIGAVCCYFGSVKDQEFSEAVRRHRRICGY